MALEYNAMCFVCLLPTSTYLRMLKMSGMLPYAVTGSPCYSSPSVCLMYYYLATSASVLVTAIKRTLIIEWYIVWPVVMNEQQRNTYHKNDWTMCSNHIHHSRFNSEQNCEGVCNHLKRKQVFTLIYYAFQLGIKSWNDNLCDSKAQNCSTTN